MLQVCIDVVVQRLGDATAAGLYKLLFSALNGKTTTVSLYALPVRFTLPLFYFVSLESTTVSLYALPLCFTVPPFYFVSLESTTWLLHMLLYVYMPSLNGFSLICCEGGGRKLLVVHFDF